MSKERKGVTPRNEKVLLITAFVVFLAVGFYLGSMTTAVAKDKEIKKLVAEEFKKQQAVNSEEESPPLKKKQKKSRSAKKLESTATATPIVTSRPTKTRESTAIATLIVTSRPTATPTATPTSTPTATPTSTPTATPTSTSTAIPTSTSTATPTSTSTPTSVPTPTSSEKPLTVEVTEDTQMFRDTNEKETVEYLKIGDKLTNVTEAEYGYIKVTHKGKEGFVYYIDTNYLDKTRRFVPVHVTEIGEQKATICRDGVELRTKPGFTCKSKLIAFVNSGDRVIIHTSEDMLWLEEGGYCKVTVCSTNQKGYIYAKRSLDWEMEFKIPNDKDGMTEEKKATEIFEGKGIEVKVIQPTKMYEGTKSGSAVKKQLNPGDKLTVQECTEADTGLLMAVYRSGNKVIKGFVPYLNTDYLDKVKRYDSVYQKKIDRLKAVVNADSVNLRSRPGITRKSKVLGNARKGTSLILLEYVEAVRYEKFGWFKAKVEDTEEVIYIYRKYVDMKNKKDEEKLKALKEESAMTVEETGNSIEKNNVVNEMSTKSIMYFAGTLSFKHLGMCA